MGNTMQQLDGKKHSSTSVLVQCIIDRIPLCDDTQRNFIIECTKRIINDLCLDGIVGLNGEDVCYMLSCEPYIKNDIANISLHINRYPVEYNSKVPIWVGNVLEDDIFPSEAVSVAAVRFIQCKVVEYIRDIATTYDRFVNISEPVENIVTSCILDAANHIAEQTKRGPGNFVIVSPRVCDMLLSDQSKLSTNDCTVPIQYVGTLHETIKVFVNTHHINHDIVVGYCGEDSIIDHGVKLNLGHVLSIEDPKMTQLQLSSEIGFSTNGHASDYYTIIPVQL